MIKKCFAILLAVMMVLSLLTACSGKTSTDTANGTTEAANTSDSSTSSSGTSSSEGRTDVIIATAQEPTVFFCQDSNFSSNQAKDSPVLFQIYENLTWMSEDGTLEPWVATEWESNEDGTEWTFTLRDDVYFSNGDKLTAEDAAFSFNLCLETNPALAGNLLINLDHAEAIDDTHVKFYLTAPFAGFVAETSTRVGFLIDKSYYDEVGAEGYNNAPIGTGAYTLKSRVSGQEIILEANENYWGGAPAIKTIKILPISNVSTQFISLKSGDIDVINIADVASCQQLPENGDVTWFTVPSAARLCMTFNDQPGGTRWSNNKDFRKAVQYAVNKEDILIGSNSGVGTILDIDPPASYAGCPDAGTYNVIEQDLDKAKEYLDASGYNGETVKVICMAGTQQEKVANILQGQLMAIGINAEISATDSGTYYAAQGTTLDYDMNIWVTSSSLNDISSCNTQYLTQKYGPIMTRQDETDALCLKANEEGDPEARKAIFLELMNIVQEEAYTVPFYNSDSVMALSKNLNGVTLNPNNAWRVMNWSWN